MYQSIPVITSVDVVSHDTVSVSFHSTSVVVSINSCTVQCNDTTIPSVTSFNTTVILVTNLVPVTSYTFCCFMYKCGWI